MNNTEQKHAQGNEHHTSLSLLASVWILLGWWQPQRVSCCLQPWMG